MQTSSTQKAVFSASNYLCKS